MAATCTKTPCGHRTGSNGHCADKDCPNSLFACPEHGRRRPR